MKIADFINIVCITNLNTEMSAKSVLKIAGDWQSNSTLLCPSRTTAVIVFFGTNKCGTDPNRRAKAN